MKKLFVLFFISALIISCKDEEIGNSKDVNPETIFTHYDINYTEGNENITCKATFRFGGDKGTTLVLANPSSVELDGKKLVVDSSKFEGAYYQTQPLVSGFSGTHQWKFTNLDKKSFTQDFSFTAINFAKTLPTSIGRSKDWELAFTGLANNDELNIEVADTSVNTTNIDQKFVVNNGKVIIAASQLAQLKNGPLTIEISKTNSSSLNQATTQGGRIEMKYELKKRTINLEN